MISPAVDKYFQPLIHQDSIGNKSLKSMTNGNKSMWHKLDKFLSKYRLAPHTTTRKTPSKHIPGRTNWLRLDLHKISLAQLDNANMNKGHDHLMKVKNFYPWITCRCHISGKVLPNKIMNMPLMIYRL